MDKALIELDRIKTTITLSMGTKNRLRKLKEGISYENYINYLIRLKEKGENNDYKNN